MRLFTTFFVFVFLFTSSMSYAIVVAPAVKVVIGTTVMTKGVEWGTQMGKAGYNYCKANKSKCKDWFGDVVDIFLGDDDDNGGSCLIRFSTNGDTSSTVYNKAVEKYNREAPPGYTYYKSGDWHKPFDEQLKKWKHIRTDDNQWHYVDTFKSYVIEDIKYIDNYANPKYPVAAYFSTYVKCNVDYDRYDDERFSDFFDRIKDKLDRDKEEEILSHPTNQPIIKKYCQGFGACIEMEAEFKKEYDKNKDDYDSDKFDEKTCQMRNGKIQSCDGAKKKKDGSDGSTGTDDKDKKDDESDDKDKNDGEDSDDKDKDKKDEDKKDDGGDGESAKCKDTDLTKELCEFLDWVDDEAKEPKNTKVDVDDDGSKKKLDDDIINVLKACPADIEFSVRMLGQSMHFEVDTMPFCLVSQKVRPYIVGAGTLSAIFILAGVRRE